MKLDPRKTYRVREPESGQWGTLRYPVGAHDGEVTWDDDTTELVDLRRVDVVEVKS